MAAKLLGAHMPTAGGLGKAVQRGHDIGCTAVQVFTSSPQQWKSKEVTDTMVQDLLAAEEATAIHSLVSHDSYLINLCAPDEELRSKSMGGLSGEIVRCARYGIPFVVSHMGAHVGQGEEVGLARVAESALTILAETPETVTLLMETTAGQGSCLNWRFEQLATILDLCKRPTRLGVCIDTCHIFAAGYDIRTPEAYEATFAEFDRLVGVATIKAIHANDSKHGLGSRKDRHEHIGKGEIGLEAFRCLVNDPRFEQTPILLETPDAETHHGENLAVLKSLCAT
ncbi:MAG TPA: deoxyribonuclease IV [Fimbriimonadaceae bacterium]|mgnify:CR=1 FL=1|nr:deoxyribonuclease IV [Fimbriimonadaceae bacterium]